MEVFLDPDRVRSPEKEKTNFITEAGLNFEQRQTSQGHSSQCSKKQNVWQ